MSFLLDLRYRFIQNMLIPHAHVQPLSSVQLFVTTWTVAHQAPVSMGFPRQEYWSGVPFPSPGRLPDPGIKTRSPALQADSFPSEPGMPVVIPSLCLSAIWCFPKLLSPKLFTFFTSILDLNNNDAEVYGVFTKCSKLF